MTNIEHFFENKDKTNYLTNIRENDIIQVMKEKVLETIKKYNLIENGDKIVIGVSGGPDSITLLNVLLEIKKENIIDFEIVVCHINHMIREEAVEDEEYVFKFCEKYNIEFYSKRINIEKVSKEKKCRNRRSRKNRKI